MSRALRAALALGLLVAAAPAAAFVRSTTSPGHPDQGLCIYWGARQVTYKVNATSAGTAPCQDAAAAQALAVQSFPAWSPSCTDFRFVNGGGTTQTAVANDGENRVIFRSGTCAAAGCSGNGCATANNCWDGASHGSSTIALTTTTFNTSTGEIVDSDMEVNGWNGANGGASGLPTGFYLTCLSPPAPACTIRDPYGQAGCIAVDVGTIVTHEAGHMLGLDHTCESAYPAPYNACPNPTSGIMNPSLATSGTVRRTLTADDTSGVCGIYPAGAATVTCSGSAPAGSSGGGCSTGGGGVGAMGLLAIAILVAWRVRARA